MKIKLAFLLMLITFLLSGCDLLSQQKKSETGSMQEKNQQQAGSQAGEEGQSYNGNLETMMGLGLPLKCEWKKDENYYGTAWIKGENSYSEVFSNGQTNSVIVKNECMWTWQEGNSQGYQFCTETSDEQTPESVPGKNDENSNVGQMKPPADLNYNCKPAVFTDSRFDPPSNMKFMDLGKMMGGQGM